MRAIPFSYERDKVALSGFFLELAPDQNLGELLEDFYHQIDPQDRALAQMIVVRPPVRFQYNIDTIKQIFNKPISSNFEEQYYSFSENFLLEVSLERFNDISIHVLYSSDYDIKVSNNLNEFADNNFSGLTLIDTEHLIYTIRIAELSSLINEGKAILPSTSGIFYELPSGRIQKSFLRAGNVQSSRYALDAIFFWTLPVLKSCASIIADTWSISSICLNISRRLFSYRGESEAVISVDMLSKYQGDTISQSKEAFEVIERVKHSLDFRGQLNKQGRKILIIVSVSHTGELINNLDSIINNHNELHGSVEFFTLFSMLARTDGNIKNALVYWEEFEFDQNFEIEDSLEIEKTDRIKFKIDSQLYFPVDFVNERQIIRQAQANNFKNFLDRYGNGLSIFVHKDFSRDGVESHRGVWIDVNQIIENEKFQERFFEKLNQIEDDIDLIITPDHSTGKALGDLAMRFYTTKELAVDAFSHPNLRLDIDTEKDRLLGDRFKDLDPSSTILILDDAYITGARLVSYQKYLRALNFRGVVVYLVAVARPECRKDWKRIQNLLKFRMSPSIESDKRSNIVDCVEFIQLPDWSESNCPWCLERLTLLENVERIENQELKILILNRIKFLDQSRVNGLISGLYLSESSDKKFSLTTGSLFAEEHATESEVFASVASAVQNLREGSERIPLGASAFPVSSIMKEEEYLFDTYTDSILRNSIFRNCSANELIVSDNYEEKKRLEYALNLCSSDLDSDRDVIFEICLKALMKKFSKRVIQQISQPDFSDFSDLEIAMMKLGFSFSE